MHESGLPTQTVTPSVDEDYRARLVWSFLCWWFACGVGLFLLTEQFCLILCAIEQEQDSRLGHLQWITPQRDSGWCLYCR